MVGQTVARGYGAEHKAERVRYEDAMVHGATYRCACEGECLTHPGRCTVVLALGVPWDLGHTEDRTGWVGPECVACNRGKGARNSNVTATMIIRDWE